MDECFDGSNAPNIYIPHKAKAPFTFLFFHVKTYIAFSMFVLKFIFVIYV